MKKLIITLLLIVTFNVTSQVVYSEGKSISADTISTVINKKNYKYAVSIFTNQNGSLGLGFREDHEKYYIGLVAENLHHPSEFMLFNIILHGGIKREMGGVYLFIGGRFGFVNICHESRRMGIGFEVAAEYEFKNEMFIGIKNSIDGYLNHKVPNSDKLENGIVLNAYLTFGYKF